jgi:hypothetical protein
MLGTIMLDKNKKKKIIRPGNFILANENAAIELKNNCPATTAIVIKKELKKYFRNGALFHAFTKFSNVTREGNILMGYENISREGLTAVNIIHTMGKTAQTKPIAQNK